MNELNKDISMMYAGMGFGRILLMALQTIILNMQSIFYRTCTEKNYIKQRLKSMFNVTNIIHHLSNSHEAFCDYVLDLVLLAANRIKSKTL
ncbi:hypothetical protein [Aquirhabdus parva]|uniref:Uncharacterized protein n=1 Tax=Aquirhabdus parva TaxID=2283318 RepID=A0A345P7U6_9GAMM|nr:hypothetical protein [Aquirhabdus parva]AXI03355.1 hypothetical protein HYN46_11175 [Aquirhabdus parva]